MIVPAATSEIAGSQNAAATLLAEICPSWSNFAIKLRGVYLGWQIGPASLRNRSGRMPQFFLSRTEQIASTQVPAVVGAYLYGERAVPVLSYLPVFGKPPPILTRLETRAVHRILHVAFRREPPP